MANVTIAIDDELLRRARIKAVSEGTSVNEVCRQAIEAYAGAQASRYEDIRGELQALSQHYRPDADGEPVWPGREALYERVMQERGLGADAPASSKKASSKRR